MDSEYMKKVVIIPNKPLFTKEERRKRLKEYANLLAKKAMERKVGFKNATYSNN